MTLHAAKRHKYRNRTSIQEINELHCQKGPAERSRDFSQNQLNSTVFQQ